jgi:hypothetical protein
MAELKTLIRYVEDYLDMTEEARRLSERDRDYYDGYQLTSEEIAVLTARKQPPVVFNRIKPKVDSLLGFERSMRSDPRAYARTPQHEKDADAITDALRYVCDDQRYATVRSAAAEYLFVEGVAGVMVTVEEGKQGFDVVLRDIPWDRLFYDPHSRRRDFSDAKYKGVIMWMDEDDALATYGESDAVIEATLSGDYDDDTFEDRPKFSWADSKRKRVRVCQIYYQEKGKWLTATFTRAGFLVEEQDSPFLDENDKPECPIILGSAYIDRENRRYGTVRQLVSPQDEINKRRSKALHLLNVRQVIAEEGAVLDVAAARAEVAKPDGFVTVNPGMRFEIVPNGEMTAGHAQLLQEAKSEIDAIGASPQLGGKEGNNKSGRAIMALQQAGLNELAVVFDAMRDLSLTVYRSIWNRIRQYWTEERWVRITDDEQNAKWVGLNKPVTLLEKAQAEGLQPGVDFDPNDPRLTQQVGVENQLSQLDVDIILEESPDTVNIQAEQFELLVQMYTANPSPMLAEAIIKASTLRNKDALLEGMKPDPAQGQMQAQMAQAGAQAQLAEVESKVNKNNAQAAKAGADAMNAGMDAQAKQYQQEMAQIGDAIAAELGSIQPTQYIP